MYTTLWRLVISDLLAELAFEVTWETSILWGLGRLAHLQKLSWRIQYGEGDSKLEIPQSFDRGISFGWLIT
jgi:hypothetical protein